MRHVLTLIAAASVLSACASTSGERTSTGPTTTTETPAAEFALQAGLDAGYAAELKQAVEEFVKGPWAQLEATIKANRAKSRKAAADKATAAAAERAAADDVPGALAPGASDDDEDEDA